MAGHGTEGRWRRSAIRRYYAQLALTGAVAMLAGASPADATVLPTGFKESVVFSGLQQPTAVRFAPDGRVFVAEKRGVVKVFDSLSDPTPTVYADLQSKVMDLFDRGMLGLAIEPGFPATGSIYVAYALDAPPGGTPPVYHDGCPQIVTYGCVTASRVSRISSGGQETVLLEDWCMQWTSHTIGALAFGPDGQLYVSGGDGANYNWADWGQGGDPANPCGDPPGSVGTALSPPTAEGGALRSQDVRTLSDPTGLDGAIIRINPQTGAGSPGNPFAASGDANARRIIAYGMRNPWRIAFRPGTNELWFSEVGWGTFEEINRITNVGDATAENFGWPCYEQNWRQPGYDTADLNLCESLYVNPTAMSSPFFSYRHDNPIVPGENCPNSGASVSGLAFNQSTNYPAEYAGALFFGDYSRNCIWVMRRDGGDLPSTGKVEIFAQEAGAPVDLQAGPGGDIFYADLIGGTIRRITYSPSRPPVARISASPASGAAPLAVSFNGSGSTDPDGEALTYQWDFDGNGTFDATGPTASHTYSAAGSYTARLRVSDPGGNADTATVTIGVGRPTPVIATPSATTLWSVGQTLGFSGSATDNKGTAIPASGLSWSLVLLHGSCPNNCHEHVVSTWSGVASGSFEAPDHEYPSSLALRLTATDASGLTQTVERTLQARTVTLAFASQPSNLELVVDGQPSTTPFSRTEIVGSSHTVLAAEEQSGVTFSNWSDGGARVHQLVAPATARTYTATYVNQPPTSSFSASDLAPDQGETVTFTASGSDPEGTALTYAWDLDGDTAYDDATGATVSKAYPIAGPVIVRLRATDARGGTAFAQRTITVGNKLPIATITPSSTMPLSLTPVSFTSTASDADGTVASRAWDLDDDGEFDDGSGVTATWTFQTPGAKVVRLRVLDDDGGEAVAVATIAVGNRPPVAAFTYLQPVRRGIPVTFTSTSTDPETRLKDQAWDLDGDGAYDDGTGTTATRTFRTPKGNVVGLRVTDLDGGSHAVRVVVLPANVLPAVEVAAFPADPFVNTPVTLTATATDGDGAIAGLAWDLDEGDAFDDGTGATITRAFSSAGAKEVRAQAIDDAGAIAIARAAVDVRGTTGTGEPPKDPERISPAPKVKVAATPTGKGAKVRRLSVKAPPGTIVRVTCTGASCPAAKRLEGAGAVKRLRRFERSYRGGAKLVVRVTQAELVGAYVKVKIRSHRRTPVRTESCLWPGEDRQRACPAG